jgi:hypothetical protein
MKSKRLTALAAATAWMLLAPAWAALGGAPSWPATPDGASKPAPQARDFAAGATAYDVIETTLPSGTRVREYVAAGTVFGIAWNGPEMAPLDTLLGTYFPSYRQALAARRAARGGGLGPAVIQAAGVVVQSGGHMGAFSGRAYLPGAIPQGASAGDIR